MKPAILLAFVALALTSLSSSAAADREYYIAELAAQPKFDVYNDGHNTYLEAIAGLVVTGATADGERYIVNGVPQRIRGFINGRPITVARGVPPLSKATPASAGGAGQQHAADRPVIGEPISAHAAPRSVAPAPSAPAANPAAAQPVPVSVVPVQQWEIKAGASLRYTLDSWCERAGYRLLWNVDGGFRSQGGHVSEGDFRKAVFDLFAAVPQDLHLRVEITKNKLVIVSKGDK
jgi:hypothetical protein